MGIAKQCIMTNSTCYKETSKSDKVGIVVHSTGVNQPYIKRYVQPSDNDPNREEILADIGKNANGNSWNEANVRKGVHAFIGKNAKGDVVVYQVLPYNYDAWGVGSGKKGSYNYAPTSHIQFEICEDGLQDADYFAAVYDAAAEYCTDLCEAFGWESAAIWSHRECGVAGFGSKHTDCDYWFQLHGTDMDAFRADVQSRLNARRAPEKSEDVVVPRETLEALAEALNQATETLTDLLN